MKIELQHMDKIVMCECGRTISKKIVKEVVVGILKKWRNTNILEAGGFQQFLLNALDT
jgi:hypothetical protein